MLISTNLHMKSSEVSTKTRSPPASFSFKGQATKHTTVTQFLIQIIIFYLTDGHVIENMYKLPYCDFVLSKSVQVSPSKRGLERVCAVTSIEKLFAPHLPCQTRQK